MVIKHEHKNVKRQHSQPPKHNQPRISVYGLPNRQRLYMLRHLHIKSSCRSIHVKTSTTTTKMEPVQDTFGLALFLLCLVIIIRCSNWLMSHLTAYLQAVNQPPVLKPTRSSVQCVQEMDEPFERHMQLAAQTAYDYPQVDSSHVDPRVDYSLAECHVKPLESHTPSTRRSNFHRRISSVVTPCHTYNYVLKNWQRSTLADELDGYDYEWDKV